MKPHKALGPDGFRSAFVQWTWDITGPLVISLVKRVM